MLTHLSHFLIGEQRLEISVKPLVGLVVIFKRAIHVLSLEPQFR